VEVSDKTKPESPGKLLGLQPNGTVLQKPENGVGDANFSEASAAKTNGIMGYYSQLRPHQYNGGLTPNESERFFWKDSKAVANFC